MKKSKRLLSLALTLTLMMVISLIPASVIPAFAASGDIVATLYADEGAVAFGSNQATISFASDSVQDYDLKVVLTLPSSQTATDKTATITLAEGLKFSNDGTADATLKSLLLDTEGVTSSVNTAPFNLTGVDMTNTGSKAYHFKDAAAAATINLRISADGRYFFEDDGTPKKADITDAITITMDYNESGAAKPQEMVKLDTLTIDSTKQIYFTGSGNYSGSAAPDTSIALASNYLLYYFTLGSWTSYPHFVKDLQATIKLDNPNCLVTNADTANWTMTYDGIDTYTFTYKGGAAALIGGVTVPARFYFPSSYFSGGEKVVATRNCTATVPDANSLTGERTVTWPSNTLTFNVIGGSSVTFLNYTSVATAVAASALAPNATSQTSTTSETLSGAVGWYTIGNKGGVASGPQTIEMNYDVSHEVGKPMLGVLALDLAIPSGQTLTTVEYQTRNEPGV